MRHSQILVIFEQILSFWLSVSADALAMYKSLTELLELKEYAETSILLVMSADTITHLKVLLCVSV